MKTKSFQDYLKTRFTDEEIAEIERKAQLEVDILKSIQHERVSTMTKNKHLGPDYDDILREEGTLEEVELAAIEMVIAEQTMNKKTFKKYLEGRFSEDELADIKKQALQEYNDYD